jgi:histidine triad (HIT) family protein
MPAKRDFYCDQVLTGAVRVNVIAETANVLAFHHTNPYWAVHVVVIPKSHIESIAALEPAHDAIVLEAMHVIARIAKTIRATHGGCRVSTNVGDQQSNAHLHWYLHAGERLRDEAGTPIDRE